VTFDAGNTFPGTFPLPALPTGTRAVPSRIMDASIVDEVSMLRHARGASPSPGMLWDEAIRHQQSLNEEGGASTVASPLSTSRISREPDRPYTPAAIRPARHARSSLVSVADPSKISRDRAQDAVYATATGTAPSPTSSVVQIPGRELPPPAAADRVRDGVRNGASFLRDGIVDYGIGSMTRRSTLQRDVTLAFLICSWTSTLGQLAICQGEPLQRDLRLLIGSWVVFRT
jgi:hypothetical protein